MGTYILSLIGFGLSTVGISMSIYLLLTRKPNFMEQLFLFGVGANSVVCATVIGMAL
jgi:hypothetical protein